MNRHVKATLTAARIVDDGDMLLRRALPSSARDSLGPFVFIDHYRHKSRRGIGDRPHPHAGIEVISYLLEGGMEHRDSMGFRDRLGPGDAQWICAGRGILHAEQPCGGRHGLQLWTSLPSAQKWTEPKYCSFRKAEIPIMERAGSRVRVVAGCVDEVVGPMLLASPTVFAYVELDAGAAVTLLVDAGHELGLYVLNGQVQSENAQELAVGMLGLLSSGSRITITAAKGRSAELVVLGGAPADRPILFSGPFVMDTRERLLAAQRDFSTGLMGRLDGVPF